MECQFFDTLKKAYDELDSIIKGDKKLLFHPCTPTVESIYFDMTIRKELYYKYLCKSILDNILNSTLPKEYFYCKAVYDIEIKPICIQIRLPG